MGSSNALGLVRSMLQVAPRKSQGIIVSGKSDAPQRIALQDPRVAVVRVRGEEPYLTHHRGAEWLVSIVPSDTSPHSRLSNHPVVVAVYAGMEQLRFKDVLAAGYIDVSLQGRGVGSTVYREGDTYHTTVKGQSAETCGEPFDAGSHVVVLEGEDQAYLVKLADSIPVGFPDEKRAMIWTFGSASWPTGLLVGWGTLDDRDRRGQICSSLIACGVPHDVLAAIWAIVVGAGGFASDFMGLPIDGLPLDLSDGSRGYAMLAANKSVAETLLGRMVPR